MRILLALCGLGLAFTAWPAVYRCEVGGRTVYTDHACAAGASPHDLPVISVLPAGEQSDLAGDHDARRARLRGSRQKEDAAWLKAHQKRKATDARMNAAAADHKVLKDMSADQVRRALGAPDEVKRKDGVEKWVYVDGKQRRTVVLKNGRVTGAGAGKSR